MPSEEYYFNFLLNSGLSKVEINKLVQEQIDKMKGLINEETALFIIAKDKGLNTEENKKLASSEKDINIGSIDESMHNINAVGRIVELREIRNFNRNDGTKGYFSWFWIKDMSGEIKVVLWDDRAKYVEQEEFKENELVRILNGQVKKNRDKILEIHVGNRGDIEINPSDVDYKKFPKIEADDTTVNIADLNLQSKRFSLQGSMILKYDARTFTKKRDNTQGMLQKFILGDDSGEIPVVLWNDDTQKITDIDEGDTLLLSNLSVKQQFRDKTKLELNFQKGSSIKIIKKADKDEIKTENKPIKISELNFDKKRFSIQGKLFVKFEERTFTKKSDNSQGMLQRIILKDDTGEILIVFWNEDTQKISEINEGDEIFLSNLNVKQQFRDKEKMELHFQAKSSIKILNKADEQNDEFDQISPINKAIEGEGFYNFHGQIVEINNIREITFKDGRVGELLSFVLSDDTEAIRITMWGETAQKYSTLKEGELIKLKKVEVKFNSFSSRNEGTYRTVSSIEQNIDLKLEKTFTIQNINAENTQSRSKGFTGNYVSITDINSEGYYEFKGYIATEIARIPIYEACSKCFRKTVNCNCENGPENTEYRMIISATLDDGTDTIRTTFIGKIAEELLNSEPIDVKLELEGENPEEFLNEKSLELMGKDIVVQGRAKFSDYSNSWEITVNKFKLLDPEEESNRIIRELENEIS